MATLFANPRYTPVDAQGDPYPGATLTFYAAGTTTPQAVYTTSALTTPHPSPVTANSAGQFPAIYYDDALQYRAILRDATGVLLWDIDTINSSLTAEEVGRALYPRSAAEISANVTPNNYRYPHLHFARYGAVGNGTADDTAALQRAINVLAQYGAGTLTGDPGVTYRITSTVDLTALGEAHDSYVIDFNGATLTWGGSGVDTMFYLFNNKSITFRNFTLIGNISTVTGFKLDSLQPAGCDQIKFSSYNLKQCLVGFDLGSVGAEQNRVSDCQFEHFVHEICDVGVITRSTNVDSIVFTNGISSGCRIHFHTNRAGFITWNTVTGFGYRANSQTNSFIYVDGPCGPQLMENCQQEDGGYTPRYFYRRADYTLSKQGSTVFNSCTIDDDILIDTGAGSDAWNLTIIGGRFGNLTVNNPDTNVTLVGAALDAGKTLTMASAATNSRLYNIGAKLYGTVTDTANAGTLRAANGYRMMPDGTIMQWGSSSTTSVSATSTATISVTYPKAFTTHYSTIVSAYCAANVGVSAYKSSVNQTATGFDAVVYNGTGASQDVGITWVAFGV